MGERHHSSRMGAIVTAAVLVFLFIPLIIVVLFSFQGTSSLSLPFHGFSTRWYSAAFGNSELLSALLRSLVIAAVTSLITLVFGTLAAYGMGRAKPGLARKAVAVLFFLPIAAPGLFLGLALVSFFVKVHLQLSLTTVLIAHCVYTFPFFLLIARVALERLDPALEEAAADLGATRTMVFRRVILPLTWPVLIGAAALAFMLSFDEFVVTYFVAGQEATLPLYLFGLLKRFINPTINVISTLMLAITLLLAVLGTVLLLFGARKEKRPGDELEIV